MDHPIMDEVSTFQDAMCWEIQQLQAQVERGEQHYVVQMRDANEVLQYFCKLFPYEIF